MASTALPLAPAPTRPSLAHSRAGPRPSAAETRVSSVRRPAVERSRRRRRAPHVRRQQAPRRASGSRATDRGESVSVSLKAVSHCRSRLLAASTADRGEGRQRLAQGRQRLAHGRLTRRPCRNGRQRLLQRPPFERPAFLPSIRVLDENGERQKARQRVNASRSRPAACHERRDDVIRSKHEFRAVLPPQEVKMAAIKSFAAGEITAAELSRILRTYELARAPKGDKP